MAKRFETASLFVIRLLTVARRCFPDTGPKKVRAGAGEWGRILADTREWSKRVSNPYYVEAEHWGP